jgi:hypothetical protein
MQYAVYITLPDGHIPLLGVSVDLDVRANLNPDKTPQGGIGWFNGSAHWARSPGDGPCGPRRSRRWQGGDRTMDEVHLCNIRLRLRRLDTMPGHRRAARRRPAGGV